jgi:hypothetical protein
MTMLILAANVHFYLGDDGSRPPNVFILTWYST